MIDLPVPAHVEEQLPHLKAWANGLAGFYGAPVYLCGSVLLGDNPKPRDWDIRMTLADEDFERLFGDPQEWVLEGATGQWTDIRWKWSRACTKEAKNGWYRCRLNVDFQIYPASHVLLRYPDHFPKMRLDEMPDAHVPLVEQGGL